MARYRFSGDAKDIARRAEDGMLPIFQSQPGFRAYTIIHSDDELISFSAWESADQAEMANRAAAGWVAENLASDVELKETRFGEILVSTALEIGVTAGIRG
jgi:heme-degrading monooxygenase HmoA